MSRFRNTDFITDVLAGRYAGHSIVQKFGYNPDVDTTSDPETIWGGATALYPWPAAAEAVLVTTGGSAEDDYNKPNGVGAYSIRVFGLDASYDEVDEEIRLNGASVSSDTSQAFLRLHRAYVTSAGTALGNAGGITIVNTTTGAIMAEISALNQVNQTTQCAYTIPNNKRGIILNVMATVSDAVGNNGGVMALMTRDPAENTGLTLNTGANEPVFRARATWGIRAGSSPDFQANVAVPEHTDIEVRCLEVTNSNTAIAAQMTILLIDDGY